MFCIRALLFVFATAAVVIAQTEMDQLPPCILNCIVTGAAEVNCPIAMDNATYNCVCTSSQFKNSTSQCLHKFCTDAEIQMALTLQTQKCTAAAMTRNTTSAPAPAPAVETNPNNSTPGSLVDTTIPGSSDAASLFSYGSALRVFGAFALGLLYVQA